MCDILLKRKLLKRTFLLLLSRHKDIIDGGKVSYFSVKLSNPVNAVITFVQPEALFVAC